MLHPRMTEPHLAKARVPGSETHLVDPRAQSELHISLDKYVLLPIPRTNSKDYIAQTLGAHKHPHNLLTAPQAIQWLMLWAKPSWPHLALSHICQRDVPRRWASQASWPESLTRPGPLRNATMSLSQVTSPRKHLFKMVALKRAQTRGDDSRATGWVSRTSSYYHFSKQLH